MGPSRAAPSPTQSRRPFWPGRVAQRPKWGRRAWKQAARPAALRPDRFVPDRRHGAAAPPLPSGGMAVGMAVSPLRARQLPRPRVRPDPDPLPRPPPDRSLAQACPANRRRAGLVRLPPDCVALRRLATEARFAPIPSPGQKDRAAPAGVGRRRQPRLANSQDANPAPDRRVQPARSRQHLTLLPAILRRARSARPRRWRRMAGAGWSCPRALPECRGVLTMKARRLARRADLPGRGQAGQRQARSPSALRRQRERPVPPHRPPSRRGAGCQAEIAEPWPVP